MTESSSLEQRLRRLIAEYMVLKRTKQAQARHIEEQQAQIGELEEQCASLRAAIDELGKDRFSLKKLKDERRIIKRKLETALKRLSALEQEL